MRKLLVPIIGLAMCGCGSGGNGHKQIVYPVTGVHGYQNVLYQSATAFTADEEYDFQAEMPQGTNLMVTIATESGVIGEDVWFYSDSDAYWLETKYDEFGYQEFVVKEDDCVAALDHFHFEGSGSATVSYYENGSDTADFTKLITW